jgi:hypothetical protein
MWQVQKEEQMCYLVHINNFNDGSIFHIVKKNLKIDTTPAQPFASEARMQAPAGALGDAVNPDHLSNQNVNASIEGSLLCIATREEIEQLHHQGITVDDDNEPAPENAQAPVPGVEPPPGTWEKPKYCCHRANTDFSDQAGNITHHQWDEIADMDELQIFHIHFPKKWIVNLVIPQTNKTLLGKPMDLQEFCVWLGCVFFMLCFVEIKDCDLFG